MDDFPTGSSDVAKGCRKSGSDVSCDLLRCWCYVEILVGVGAAKSVSSQPRPQNPKGMRVLGFPRLRALKDLSRDALCLGQRRPVPFGAPVRDL